MVDQERVTDGSLFLEVRLSLGRDERIRDRSKMEETFTAEGAQDSTVDKLSLHCCRGVECVKGNLSQRIRSFLGAFYIISVTFSQ